MEGLIGQKLFRYTIKFSFLCIGLKALFLEEILADSDDRDYYKYLEKSKFKQNLCSINISYHRFSILFFVKIILCIRRFKNLNFLLLRLLAPYGP